MMTTNLAPLLVAEHRQRLLAEAERHQIRQVAMRGVATTYQSSGHTSRSSSKITMAMRRVYEGIL